MSYSQKDDREVTRLVFWQEHDSVHTRDWIDCAAQLNPTLQVISLTGPGQDSQRRLWGWEEGPMSRIAEHRCLLDASECEVFTDSQAAQTIHILLGPASGFVRTATRELRIHKSGRFLIMAEPRVTEGLKGTLRITQSLLRESWLRRNATGVLAIGRHGPRWFEQVGYDPHSTFPFAYFIAPLTPFPPPAPRSKDRDTFVVGYVGRLVSMKGIPELIDAASELDFPYELKLAGAGPLEKEAQAQTDAMGVNATWLGQIHHADLAQVLSDFDCLALPSRSMDDGWGVVVSEALMQGIPVITTERVGASSIVEGPFGCVVAARSSTALSQAISRIRRAGYSTSDRRLLALRARRMLSAEVGAEYLGRILDYLLGRSNLKPAFPKPQENGPVAGG